MNSSDAHFKGRFQIGWIYLICIAALPRILGALWLPNMFGDAYVYIRDIGAMSTKLKSGTFALNELYGFWLPVYQFLSALLNVLVNNGFYVGKIVSSIFGAGVCVLLYAIAFDAIAIMSMPAAFWFYISHKATGDWLACFRIRQQYHDWLLVQNPALSHFSFGGVLKDSATFLVSTDIAVLIATFAAAWLVWKFPQCSPQDNK